MPLKNPPHPGRIVQEDCVEPRERPGRHEAMIKYEIIIYWSDEDQAYVADVPELPGCSAHGDDAETALSKAHEAIRLWIDTAKEFGDPVPEPKGRRLMVA